MKTVIKRNGTRESFDPTKINKWGEWGKARLEGVDWSSIVLQAIRKCYDGCTTKELHQAMIDACCEKETAGYMMMAGRMLAGDLYKEVFGDFDKIPTLAKFYEKMTSLGLWVNMDYTTDELDTINSFIDHDKDLMSTHTELNQIQQKYLLQDRVTGQIYETPQFMFVGMAMAVMENQPKDRRLNDIKQLYTYLSDKKINAPTPFMVYLRTPRKNYASCCVSTTNDSVDSLAAGDHIAYMMTCAGAGIGHHVKTRSKGDPVRSGTVQHLGKLPYYRMIQSAVSANMQASRGGNATVYYNVLDPEIEDLLVLKNPTTVIQKQIKGIDYSVGINTSFVKRVAKDEDWMLLSYQKAPDLYESFYNGDAQVFEDLYNKYDKDPLVVKSYVSARDIALKMLTQSIETGRIYLHWADRMNAQTPFKDTIYSSNLCSEIGLPTKGYNNVSELYKAHEEGAGEIGLCNLSAIVAGRVTEEEYYDVAYYTLLMIDNVISLMEYPFENLRSTAQARRSVGVGITNLAYALAKEGLNYTSVESKNYIHRLAELHSFCLHRASLQLAKEKGVAPWMHKTKYPTGWFPHDDAVKAVDSVHSQPLLQDWEMLKKEIVALGGIRNSVLEAYMPCESSSVASNTTNGLYPVRSLKIIKTGSTGRKNIFLAPEYDLLKDKYQLAFDVDNKDLIDVYAIFQKFTGQAISADEYISYSDSHRKVSSKELIKSLIYKTKMGLKTRYYINSSAGVQLVDKFNKVNVEHEIIEDQSECEACKL